MLEINYKIHLYIFITVYSSVLAGWYDDDDDQPVTDKVCA